MFVRTLIVIVLLASASPALAQDEANEPNINWPGYREGDYVVHAVQGHQKSVGVRPEADVDLDHTTDTTGAESRPRRCCSIVGAQFLHIVAFQSGLQNAAPYGLDILRRELSVVGPQMEDKSVRRSNISSCRRPVEDCESV